MLIPFAIVFVVVVFVAGRLSARLSLGRGLLSEIPKQNILTFAFWILLCVEYPVDRRS